MLKEQKEPRKNDHAEDKGEKELSTRDEEQGKTKWPSDMTAGRGKKRRRGMGHECKHVRCGMGPHRESVTGCEEIASMS